MGVKLSSKRINVLSPLVANQIAAGEVVERPASVVKELVENSIDAGADRICIEIEDGGINLIKVSDNGCGIRNEECATAFLRHATSKISESEDLSRITSLGFRGEALASIASVASVSLCSRNADDELGCKYTVEFGTAKGVELCARNIGTDISVRDLFVNIPARLKFLKSPRSEAGSVGDFVARCILAYPALSFSYISNGRTVYETTGGGELKDAICQIYGLAVAEQLLPVEYDNGYIRIEGFIGSSQLARPNRNQQSFFVNGRSIKSNALSFSLLRAYDTRLMSGKYPFAVLKIKLAAEQVDVNVHPAKTEVRFANEVKVTQSLFIACRAALTDEVYVYPEVNVACAYIEKEGKDEPCLNKSYNFESKTTYSSDRGFAEKSYTPQLDNRYVMRDSAGSYSAYSTIKHEAIPASPAGFMPARWEKSAAIKIVGCLFDSYWVVEQGEDMFLLDQHAAHERKLYEQLVKQEVTISKQKMLIPLEITLSPSEYEAAIEHKNELNELGYEWQDEEQGLSLRISTIPVLSGKLLSVDCFREAISLLANVEKKTPEALVRERLIQSACKHAVKAGDALQPEEIEALLAYYSSEGVPTTCPHGRPVITRISKREIEKMFRRIV